MKKFLVYTLAAFIGAGLAFFAFLIFSLLLGAVAVGSASDQAQTGKPLKEASVLKLDLSSALPERKNNIETRDFSFETEDVYGFYDVIKGIRKAKDSKKIKGILLDATSVALGHTQILSVINELNDFKKSGKFIYAHGVNFSQHGYALASCADSIFMHPLGMIELKGYGTVRPYYNGLREKLGVDVTIYNTGDFKSAGENLVRDEMSEANRKQTMQYLAEIKVNLVEVISRNRNISAEKVDRLMDRFLIDNIQDALEEGLVDVSGYGEEVQAYLNEHFELDEGEDAPVVVLKDWLKSISLKQGKGDKKIALLFAEGAIKDNSEDKGIISDKIYVPMIDKITENEDIEALVLRVNSPGGSVMASDNINAAIERCKDSGKKIVVSMGDVAASGGYYISMNSDYIFAEESTITGSIGVVSIVPNFGKMLKQKVGVSFDTVVTDPMSVGFTTVFPWSDDEKGLFQNIMDDFYEVFVGKVSAGRSMDIESVKKVAGGRVWTGKKALELGLIDGLGGIEDAIAKAEELAEIEEAKIEEYPKFQSPLLEMLESFNKSGDMMKHAELKALEWMPETKNLMDLAQGSRFQFTLVDRVIY